MIEAIRYYDNKLAELLIICIRTLYGVASYSLFISSILLVIYTPDYFYAEGMASDALIANLEEIYGLLGCIAWIFGALIFLVVPIRNTWLLGVPLLFSFIIGILNV